MRHPSPTSHLSSSTVRFNVRDTKQYKFRMDYMWAQSFKTFYRLHDMATNWHQARQICEVEGTSLFVPDNLDEMENLKLLISNMKAHYTAIFIGIHDQYASGDYVNLKGELIRDTILNLLWAQGSPDNLNGTEHCVVMTREGLFDDKQCSDIFPFVCKIMGSNIKYNENCDNYDSEYINGGNGKCYKYHVEPLSWHDAYMVCKAEEGNLAIINSASEATLINSYLGQHLNSIAPDPNILHIGFSDLMFPYQYRTIKGQTLEDAGYSSWNPEKEGSSFTNTKRCGAISRTGFLQVTWCDRPAMFLCEKNINSTP
ncbi:secretory phospholipase A2 receptor-like [Achroia grisella]|uniref:secretory phospholipase A2 receptor-like n=1 Tax=Achroia grisella TaxID=688607 RepID=UPI0027D21B15|nr:secretory phospholipase A2 receptor-like [Achroia grisella]